MKKIFKRNKTLLLTKRSAENKMPFNQNHCPRCQNIAIIEHPDSIECPNCNLEFDKSDFDKFEDENVLAIQEKKNFIDNIN